MGRLIVCLSLLVSVSGFMLTKNSTDSYVRVRSFHKVQNNAGQPLYLTPFLEKGRIREARKMSTVQLPNLKSVKSYTGYFTVNKKCGSNLFFWFFAAQQNWKKAPVVLWLQGGPGVSSLYGLFEELGPISFNGKLRKRRYPWNVKNNVLFIDQPVGTGFSFTRNNCFATNETQVSEDLYSGLTQFYQLFPFLQKNKFYITGESYGGHYVPSIGYAIHKKNPSAKLKINLSGLMIGNGLMDVIYQSDYNSYLYQLGLIDDHQRDVLRGMQEKMIEQLKNEDWKSGSRSNDAHFDTLNEFIGDVSVYNFLEKSDDPNTLFDMLNKMFATPDFRKTLHVGNNDFVGLSDKVYKSLHIDMVQSVKSKVEELLEHYPVIFYHGQLDIICAYPMAVNFFRNLQWSGAKDYLQAERHEWCVKDQLAGFFKSAHNLHEVLVRDAGHMVPKDQPLWAFQLVNSVTASPAQDPLRQLRTCGNSR